MEDLLLALGAPRRREILRLVWRGETSAGEIHRALGGVTFGAVSQHLGVLQRAGLLTARREGRHRMYGARPEGLEPLKQWIESMWEGALTSLKRLAEEDAAQDRGAPPSPDQFDVTKARSPKPTRSTAAGSSRVRRATPHRRGRERGHKR